MPLTKPLSAWLTSLTKPGILVFWFTLLSCVLAYLLILLAVSRLPISLFFHANQIPLYWQTIYITGLYLILWILSFVFIKKQQFYIQVGSLLNLSKGMALSFISACCLLAVLTGFKLSLWIGFDFSWLILVEVSLMAVALASIEEYVFRGFHFEVFKSKNTLQKAALFQALIYAFVHLLRSDLLWFHWLVIFFNLSLIGFILARVRLITNSLTWPIGLHAGWIIATNLATRSQAFEWNTHWNLWSGQGNPAYGLSGSFCLLLVLWMMHSANSDHPGQVV